MDLYIAKVDIYNYVIKNKNRILMMTKKEKRKSKANGRKKKASTTLD